MLKRLQENPRGGYLLLNRDIFPVLELGPVNISREFLGNRTPEDDYEEETPEFIAWLINQAKKQKGRDISNVVDCYTVASFTLTFPEKIILHQIFHFFRSVPKPNN